MAEQEGGGGDKSFEATPQKIEDARRRGDIAKSQDIGVAAAYFGLLAALLLAGAGAVSGAGQAMIAAFAGADRLAPRLLATGGDAISLAYVSGSIIPLAPLFAVPLVFVLAVTAAQRAFVFAPEKLAPKLSRLSPISNAKQKFGFTGLFTFAKAAVKLVTISAILFFFLSDRTDEIIGLARSAPKAAPGAILSLAIELFWRIALIAAVIAAIDYLWQRADHARKLRMTHQEVRDEHKRSEGDPTLKAQRRQRAEEIATNQMMLEVPKADVVIVNPTHYAVALRWRRGEDDAPRVVAKGVDGVALRIRETAERATVPIHEDPPTARALEASVEIGHEIEPQHYQAVAAAIRFAEAMRFKARARGGAI